MVYFPEWDRAPLPMGNQPATPGAARGGGGGAVSLQLISLLLFTTTIVVMIIRAWRDSQQRS